MLKVWLTTILVSPFLIWVGLAMVGEKQWLEPQAALLLILMSIVLGAKYSLPATVFLFFSAVILKRYVKSDRIIKVVLSILAVATIFVTFAGLDRTFVTIGAKNLVFPVCYIIIMVTWLWVYSLDSQTKLSSII